MNRVWTALALAAIATGTPNRAAVVQADEHDRYNERLKAEEKYWEEMRKAEEKRREHLRKAEEKRWQEAKRWRERERESAQRAWERQRDARVRDRRDVELPAYPYRSGGYVGRDYYAGRDDYTRYPGLDRFDYLPPPPPQAYGEQRPVYPAPTTRYYAPDPYPPQPRYVAPYAEPYYGEEVVVEPSYGSPSRGERVGASIGARIGRALGGAEGAAIGAGIGRDIGAEVEDR